MTLMLFNFRLQLKYMPVPGTVGISAREVYQSYRDSMPHLTESKLLSKQQVAIIVPQIFPNITIKKTKDGCFMYQGLRQNFLEDKSCDLKDIDNIAQKSTFFRIPSGTDIIKYGFMTGFHVNKNELMKVLEFRPDRNWNFFVGERPVDLSTIGLSDITCGSYQSVEIIFHTVGIAKLCKGKPVNRKLSPRYGCVSFNFIPQLHKNYVHEQGKNHIKQNFENMEFTHI